MKNLVLAISEKKEILKKVKKELAHNYEIITVVDLIEAVDVLKENDINIVLVDENIQPFTFEDAKKKLTNTGKEFSMIALISEYNEEISKTLKKIGVYNYVEKPVIFKNVEHVLSGAIKNLELTKENNKLKEDLRLIEDRTEIMGQSEKIRDIKNMIDKFSEVDAPILITGEIGVGKDLTAHEIYKKSERKKEGFKKISCALFPGELFEREFFGYDKDAFATGSSTKPGLLEYMDGGTIYIEDIDLMEGKIQNRLIKFIDYGEFKRFNGTKLRKSDVRIFVGSSKNLKEECEKGNFKKELYHRVSTFNIEVPPLRERKEDIPLLANVFLTKIVRDLHRDTPVISGEAMKFLMEYSYPANTRELKNIIERMAMITTDKILDIETLPLEIKMKSEIIENKTVIGLGPLKEILEQEIYGLDDVERVVIATALQKTRWNKQETSKLLGIGRTTLYEKIRKYGLGFK